MSNSKHDLIASIHNLWNWIRRYAFKKQDRWEWEKAFHMWKQRETWLSHQKSQVGRQRDQETEVINQN